MDFSTFFEESDRKWRYWAPKATLLGESKGFESYTTRELSTSHKKRVQGIGWNCDGELLASASSDRTLKLFGLKNNKSVGELKGHTDAVWQLSWDPTHVNRLASASKDSTVRIWDARTNKSTKKIETVGQNITIKWSPKGNYIAVGNLKDVVSIIDVRAGKILISRKFPFMVHAMGFDMSETYFIITTGNGTLDVMQFPKIAPALTIEAHTGHCHCLEIAKDGKLLATGGADALVQLWDTTEMVCVNTFSRLDSPVRSISISHDSKYIASSCHQDGTASKDPESRIDISEVDSGISVHTGIVNHEIQTIAWNPKKRIIACGGNTTGGSSGSRGVVSIFGPRT